MAEKDEKKLKNELKIEKFKKEGGWRRRGENEKQNTEYKILLLK